MVEFNIGEQIINSKGKKSVKEHGYFIAKTTNPYMQPYIDKFDKLLKGKKSLTIQLLENDTFSIQRIRYNQGGRACYCKDNEDTGKQKEKNLWKSISCDSSCKYLIKDDKGTSACNRVGWLKFFIPEVSRDRIWLMKITGQESIDNIDAYIQLQKSQGNSLNNLFTLFLTQKEQINCLGYSFNNYVLDILVKDESISNNKNLQTNHETKSLATKSSSVIDNHSQNISSNKTDTSKVTVKNDDTKKTATINETNNVDSEKTQIKDKKTTKRKTKKDEKKDKISQNQEEVKFDVNKIYSLEAVFEEKITTKNGIPKEYTGGRFYDVNGKTCDILVKPEYADELKECTFGTCVEIQNIQESAGKKFALDFKFVEKRLKSVAA